MENEIVNGQTAQLMTDGLLVWLLLALVIVALLFWSIYKALKTRNPKYGYGILFSLLLMILLLFI